MKKGILMKKYGVKKALFCACFVVSTLMFSNSVVAQTRLYTSTSDTSKEESFTYYEGKVTSGVNIRVGAGVDKDKLVVKGKSITLAKGTIVTIIETQDVGNKPWYKVRFTYNKKEIEGYATSTYIVKTGVEITPTPIPEKEPEPTLEPTKAPEPTKAAEEKATPVSENEQDTKTENETTKDDKTLVYGSIAVIVIAAIGGCVYLYLRKKDEYQDEQAVLVSEKVAKLKDIAIGSKEDRMEQEKAKTFSQVEKKKPEVRVSKGENVLRQADLITNKSDVYVIKSKEANLKDELELTATIEAIDYDNDCDSEEEMDNTLVQQENVEKKSLRLAINNLKEHDIVLHKYFGRGEVYDNSDVRLIEVRFGSDARFLNKEQLINRKLIQITNEKKRY